MTFQQESHKLLMIPGPIEVSDEVLYANAHPSVAHISPDFIEVFGASLEMLRKVVDSPSGQPFIVAGSGTLGWDMAAANILQAGDEVLVATTGYFGDSFAECLETYGAKPTQLTARVGTATSVESLKEALQAKKYKALTITHVDTSTGILNDVEALAKAVKETSPETLVIVDGVCSVGSEEIHMDQWGVDYLLFGSQKGLGCPPGLCLSVAGPRAIKAFEQRTTPPAMYFGSWKKWMPIMQNYEARKPSYFATPATNLVYALHCSLTTITASPDGLRQRFQQHRDGSKRVKAAIEEMGLEQLALPESRNGAVANGMTAVRYPPGVKATDLLPRMAQRGVVFGAGLHKDCKDEYFRIGHMGVSVCDPSRTDIQTILQHLKEALAEAQGK